MPTPERFPTPLLALVAFPTILASLSCEHPPPTIEQPQSLEATLTRLAAGVYVKVFDDLLGTPAFVSQYGTVQERIYVFDEAYVQAIVSDTDTVLAFSVTTRSDSFHPAFYFWNGTDRHVAVRLGETKFSELDQMFGRQGPDSYTGFLGARRFFYAEQLYLGNPSNYQTFVFALNDSGHVDEATGLDLLDDLNSQFVDSATETWFTDTTPTVQAFRSRATINTIMITAPSIGPESLLGGPTVGPDSDQVRVLETTKPPNGR